MDETLERPSRQITQTTGSNGSITTGRSRRRLSSLNPKAWRGHSRSSISSTANTLASKPLLREELFEEPYPVSAFLTRPHDLSWYHPWLHRQLKNIQEVVRNLKVGDRTLLDGNGFERVFEAVATLVRDAEGISIDEIVSHLQETLQMESDAEPLRCQRVLVFAILGWQSMLFRPSFNIQPLDFFTVDAETGTSSSGLVFDNNTASAGLADRPLFVVLKAFGNLLPSPPREQAQAASEHSRAAVSWQPLNPAETNAYLLHTLLKVNFRWVDSISLHLDYNKSTRILSLYSCPSLCTALLHSPHKSTIHAFASTEKSSFDPRANQSEIDQLLREILLSYRLLFAQSGPSRRLFSTIYSPPESLPVPDQLLPWLCMTKNNHDIADFAVDQPVYFAAQHFPVLYDRVELIASELRRSRPHSMVDLVRDRRDTLQYWTFWLVSIIGGASIVLSTIQVVLQAVQLAKS